MADGILMAGPPEGPLTALSVSYHRVSVAIEGASAVTRVDQAFLNNRDTDLEASYLFPIPEKAAIGKFALHVNGRRLNGEILDREEARRVYEEIVREMKDPALLEYVGRDLFRARVYPVPAGGRTRIELEYTEIITYDAGMFKYRYPLDTERFSPAPLEEVAIAARISSPVPLKSVYSPSHEVDVSLVAHEATVGYEARQVTPDRDFILYYTVSERDLGMSLLTFRKNREPGYFLLMLSPGDLAERTLRKEVIFVVDTSGSMSGQKLEQAAMALRFCVDRLNESDRFNILQFATTPTAYRDSLVLADREGVKGAHRFIDGMVARGGTNINDALLSACAMFGPPSGDEEGMGVGGPRMIVFLTDGEPTVGVTGLADIVENVGRLNVSSARLFIFGVGNDVNTHLLDRLSEENRGLSEYVRSHEDIELRVSSFFRKVSEPVLADTRLVFDGVEVSEIYPISLPDIFRGSQLLVLGRYRGAGNSSVVLEGKVQGRETRIIYEGSFSGKSLEYGFIPRLWATRKIGYLMGEIRLNGERPELVDEIVLLSKEYGVMTPYTSYLVLEHDADYEAYGIEPAADIVAGGAGFRKAMQREKGEDAVRSAEDIFTLKESSTPQPPALETVRWVGHKTFYLRKGFWIDSEYTRGMEVREVEAFSREYFDLLAEHPGVGIYFALSAKVLFVYEGTCYRVTDEGSRGRRMP
jgi:Ca-activated chloride channel family protein